MRPGNARTRGPISIRFSILPPWSGTWWFRILALISAFALLGGAMRYIEMRRIQRQFERLQQERELERERARISRDMHDEVGATLTQISILSELAKQQAGFFTGQGGPVDQIADKSREVIDSIGEIVWAINPDYDSIEDLVAYLRQYTLQYFRASSIACRFEAPERLASALLSAEARRNIFLSCKEAMQNVLKHSQAAEVRVRLLQFPERLEIMVEDNGKGVIPRENPQFGNGLKNMERRMREIGGSFLLESKPGDGTRVKLSAPSKT
jgi:signal transduction histidine kinase